MAINIDSQIEEILENPSIMNNFYSNLPEGLRTKRDSPILNKIIYLGLHHSKKRNSQSAREFHKECKQATIKTGVTIKQIIETREKCAKDAKYFDSFFELRIPIYKILLEKGYNYNDLSN